MPCYSLVLVVREVHRMAALERRRWHQSMLLFQRVVVFAFSSRQKGTLPKLITSNDRYLEGISLAFCLIKMTYRVIFEGMI